MQLVAKYLNAVKQYLPESDREDIVEELAETIRSEIEERAAALGRPLNAAELEAILKRLGRPVDVGGRYREGEGSLAFGREWIGPALFPFYRRALLFNLVLTLLVLLAALIGLSIAGRPIALATFLYASCFYLVLQFAIVTLLCAVVQRQVSRTPGRWDVQHPDRLVSLTCSLQRRRPTET
jgi:hypothetical protein